MVAVAVAVVVVAFVIFFCVEDEIGEEDRELGFEVTWSSIQDR